MSLVCVLCLFTVSKSLAAADWSVKISATLSYAPPYSADCTFGVKAGATNSFDSALGDQITAPAPPDGVDTWFAYPTDVVSTYRKLSTSYISDSGTPSWTCRVQTISVEGTMTRYCTLRITVPFF
jgi:hypothetical protein